MIIDRDSFVGVTQQLKRISDGLLAAIRTLEPAEDEAVVSAVADLLDANEGVGALQELLRAIYKANREERPDPRAEGTLIS